ncbi:MAG: sulfatase-like hydrolase/transferase [Acidobacteriota bacterium]
MRRPDVRRRSILLVPLALLLGALACGGPPSDGDADAPAQAASVDEPRLVVLYATCTVKPYMLAPYDPAVGYTPSLARFAAESVTFPHHRSESGQSGPAFATLFGGVQADRHGVYGHPTPIDPDDVTLITAHFANAGWDVHTWLEHPMASAALGYAAGTPENQRYDHKLTAEDPVFAGVLARLAADPSYRALVVTNFTVTHGPYQRAPLDAFCADHGDRCGAYTDDPAGFDFLADFYQRAHAFLSYDFEATAEFAGLASAQWPQLAAVVELLYRANVANLDRLFGAVVDAVDDAGLRDASVIAFTADHGETLFRDGTLFKWTHGHQLAPEVLAVPFILRAPGRAEPGTVYGGISRSIDVLPTLAGLVGLMPLPPPLDGAGDVDDPLGPHAVVGRDLAPALRGEMPPPALRAFSHTSLLAEAVVEASRRWGLMHRYYPRVDVDLIWAAVHAEGDDGVDRVAQLRRTPEDRIVPHLFEIADDRYEQRDRYDAQDRTQRRLLRDLKTYRDRMITIYHERHADAPQLDDAHQRELLDSLGYIGG